MLQVAGAVRRFSRAPAHKMPAAAADGAARYSSSALRALHDAFCPALLFTFQLASWSLHQQAIDAGSSSSSSSSSSAGRLAGAAAGGTAAAAPDSTLCRHHPTLRAHYPAALLGFSAYGVRTLRSKSLRGREVTFLCLPAPRR